MFSLVGASENERLTIILIYMSVNRPLVLFTECIAEHGEMKKQFKM